MDGIFEDYSYTCTECGERFIRNRPGIPNPKCYMCRTESKKEYGREYHKTYVEYKKEFKKPTRRGKVKNRKLLKDVRVDKSKPLKMI